MSKNEKLQGNKASATLFVGVGGIGSKIIRRVCDLAKNDDLSKARFVIMDTDVNDLTKTEDGIKITPIQTSSPRTIRDYLLQDEEARSEWFPNNMIINGKTVSEGAGQVRAISRLALNATIKTGRIKALYAAIDELYNKDGADKRQTVKVVVASTVAGGTGSGIAMIVAMLIRNYISENYPDSSAIIRGFLLMPGVLDTFQPSTSEQLSLQRNGYATIKEINAFMMRPFFEAVPELNRYLDLHIEVPNAAGGVDKLNCTPFDFCFLFDRTDENVSNMTDLQQYWAYAAQSIYELCIGPMSTKASSKEDNIHKEFLDDKKLSRNRFCGAGAAVVRYPYELIRDYIAFDWIERQIIGMSTEDVDDSKTRSIIKNSWLVYDADYQQKKDAYSNNPGGTAEPVLSEIYVNDIETGSESFTKMLKEKHIDPLNERYARIMLQGDGEDDDLDTDDFETDSDDVATIPAVEAFIQQLMKRVIELCEQSPVDEQIREDFNMALDRTASSVKCMNKYRAIESAKSLVEPDKIAKVVRSFADRVFNNSEVMTGGAQEAYLVESFLKFDGKALHPNAMRYLLYKLLDKFNADSKEEPNFADFDDEVSIIIKGRGINEKTASNASIAKFQVPGGGKEQNLKDMAARCDELGPNASSAKVKCNELLDEYAAAVKIWYDKFARYYIAKESKAYVANLISQFEDFYNKFESKITSIKKLKKTILTKMAFRPGNCEYNLFNNPVYLKKLVIEQKNHMPTGDSKQERDLYRRIYNAVKENSQRRERIANNTFSNEVMEDIFDSVIISMYKEMVDERCKDEINIDIIRACGLEHHVKCLCEADLTPDEAKKEELKKLAVDAQAKNAHMIKIINKGKAFASPSIIRKDFEESRAVDAMAYNKHLEEGDDMLMPESLFAKDYASETVSKYEFRFYRSVYNITPIQIQKLSAPQADPGKIGDKIEFGKETDPGMVGAYFEAYQDYMAKIGPDNRLNPVITPHIDKRWNSITILPELDPQGYQRILMKRIHKAMIYGFIYQLIEKRPTSPHDMGKLIYEYVDGRNGNRKFIVSNHTKCDRLFEVLDSFYFDRYAVHSIHNTVDRIRKKEFESSTHYTETTFARYVHSIDREMLIDIRSRKEKAAQCLKNSVVSLFEIPMLYIESLPKKDSSELEIMVDAIFEIIEKEIATFVDSDDAQPLIAEEICKQYNLLYRNFVECPAVYTNYVEVKAKDNVAIKLIRKKVIEKLDDLDVSKDDPKFMLCDMTEKDSLLF